MREKTTAKPPAIDPIPESFATPEEAGEFWDSHSTADYEDEMVEVDFEVDLAPSALKAPFPAKS